MKQLLWPKISTFNYPVICTTFCFIAIVLLAYVSEHQRNATTCIICISHEKVSRSTKSRDILLQTRRNPIFLSVCCFYLDSLEASDRCSLCLQQGAPLLKQNYFFLSIKNVKTHNLHSQKLLVKKFIIFISNNNISSINFVSKLGCLPEIKKLRMQKVHIKVNSNTLHPYLSEPQ